MAKTVYVAQSNYLDVPKVFGNVKALYDFALSMANTETPHLDRDAKPYPCLLYTSPSPRDRTRSRMPSSA